MSKTSFQAGGALNFREGACILGYDRVVQSLADTIW